MLSVLGNVTKVSRQSGQSEGRRTDLFVRAVGDAVDERRDRAFFGFPDIAAEMFTRRQTTEEHTQ